MRLDYAALVELSDGEDMRTVTLSAFTLNLCLSLLRTSRELFWWGKLTDNEKDTLDGLVGRANKELMANPMLGFMFWTIIQPSAMGEQWIVCEGGNYAMADYPELMTVYPSILKNYPSSGRFTVPDMRGRVPVGVSANFPYLSTGGEINHTLTVGEMPAHTHSEITAVGAVINGGLEAPAAAAIPGAGFTGSQGSGQPHNNMPPYGAAYWYMVAR